MKRVLFRLDCTSSELCDDGIRIVDAASPNAPARLNECRPKTRVIRQRRMRRKVFTRFTSSETAAPLLSREKVVTLAD